MEQKSAGNVISLLPTLPNENGEVKSIYIMNLISVLTILGDNQFPAKLNTVHGEVAHMQITVVDEKSGNSAPVFQHLSFQSYHVIHQQEFNTLKH